MKYVPKYIELISLAKQNNVWKPNQYLLKQYKYAKLFSKIIDIKEELEEADNINYKSDDSRDLPLLFRGRGQSRSWGQNCGEILMNG